MEKTIIVSKRILAFLLCAALALTFTPFIGAEPARADGAEEFDTMKYEPVKPITIHQYTKGDWDTDASEEQFYRYYTNVENILSEGDVLTFSNSKDESVRKQYTYSEGKFTNNADSTDVLPILNEHLMNNFHVSNDQDTNHWDQVGDYTASLEYKNMKSEFTISIIKNPISAISVEPAEKYEFIEDTGGGICKSGEGDEYYRYDVNFKNGDKLTVSYVNGSDSNIYEFSEDKYAFVNVNDESDVIDRSEIITYDTQYKEHWQAGNDYNVTVEYMGRTCNVTASVKNNPISSISFNPKNKIEFIEGIDGNVAKDSEGKDYFCYNLHFSAGDELKINYSNSETKTYVISDSGWDFVNVDDNTDIISQSDVTMDSNQYLNHWLPGNEYDVTVSYMGKNSATKASVIENPVKSISYTPKTPYVFEENLGGRWECEGRENDKIFYVYRVDLRAGDELTVTNSDDSQKTYVFDDDERVFVNKLDSKDVLQTENDSSFDTVSYYDDQYDTHFEPGKKNCFFVKYMGRVCTVDVEIKPTTVKSVTYSPNTDSGCMEYYEYTHGYYWTDKENNPYYVYYPKMFGIGDTITVEYKDGTKVVYECEEDEESDEARCKCVNKNDPNDSFEINGDGYGDFVSLSNQHNEHWKLGKDNNLTFKYRGVEFNIPVWIKENPVNNIQFKPKDPKECEYDSIDSYMYYYCSEFYEGDELTVTYKESTGRDPETYVYDEEKHDFISRENGVQLEYSPNVVYAQNEQPWVVGSENYYYIKCGSAETKVMVTVLPEPDADTYEVLNAMRNAPDEIWQYNYRSEEGRKAAKEYIASIKQSYDNLTANQKQSISKNSVEIITKTANTVDQNCEMGILEEQIMNLPGANDLTEKNWQMVEDTINKYIVMNEYWEYDESGLAEKVKALQDKIKELKGKQNENDSQNEGIELAPGKTDNKDKPGNANTDYDAAKNAVAAKVKAAKTVKAKIKAKALKGKKVKLTWKKVKNVSGFEVYQAAKEKGKYKKVAIIKKAKTIKWTSKKLKKIKKGEKVFYKVRVFTKIDGKKIYGKWSNIANAKIKK